MKALVLSSILFATPVVAQSTLCAEKEVMYQSLQNTYGEQRVFIGPDVGGILVEVFVNPDTGSFTLLSTDPLGISCIQANGEAFDLFHLKPNV